MISDLSYCVYILECSDTTYYTGITNNLEKRLSEHNSSQRGAKYTHFRRPVTLLYHEKYPNKSEALKREFLIKKMTRLQKEALWISG